MEGWAARMELQVLQALSTLSTEVKLLRSGVYVCARLCRRTDMPCVSCVRPLDLTSGRVLNVYNFKIEEDRVETWGRGWRACVYACVCTRARACVRACVHACVIVTRWGVCARLCVRSRDFS